jgi:hypothetical protein
MKIRSQATIEFILISVAVISFMVFFLGLYASSPLQKSATYNAITAIFANNTPSTTNAVSALIVKGFMYIPTVTYVNRSNPAYLLFYINKNVRIERIRLESQNIDFIPSSYTNISSSNPDILYFSMIPSSIGNHNIIAYVEIGNDSVSKNVVLNSSTISMPDTSSGNRSGTAANQTRVYASIIRHNESLLYGMSSPTQIQSITESRSCTYLNWWDSPLPINEQCGSSAVWQVRIFSGQCFDEGISNTWTYCFYLQNEGSANGINSNYSNSYNITLGMKVNNRTLESNMSSLKSNSDLFYGNRVYGNASTNNNDIISYGPQLSNNFVVLGGNVISINYLQSYLQYLNNAKGILNYYNNSGVGASELSSIQQAISSSNDYISALDSAPNEIGKVGCNLIQNKELICKPESNFIYGNITAYLSMNPFGINVTVYAEGSTIYIK